MHKICKRTIVSKTLSEVVKKKVLSLKKNIAVNATIVVTVIVMM